MKRKFSKIILWVALLGLSPIILLKCIVFFVDKQEMKLAIEKGLHESTGVNFRIKALSLEPTFFHGLQIHLNTSTITDMRKNPLGSVGAITVEVRYLPIIIHQTPEIGRIEIDHVLIPVGKYSFFKELKLKLVKPKKIGFLNPAEMKDTEILLKDYRIMDVAIAPEVKKLLPKMRQFSIQGKEAKIRHVESKKPIAVYGSGWFLVSLGGRHEIPTGKYKLELEISQEAVKKSTFKKVTPAALTRLDFKVEGPQLAWDIHYKHPKRRDGDGSFKVNAFNFVYAQTIALQLSNTFGFPVPKNFKQFYLSGRAAANGDFKLRFLTPHQMSTAFFGKIRLKDAALTQVKHWPIPLLSHVNGEIRMNGGNLGAKRLDLQLGTLPFRVRAVYNLNRKTIDAEARNTKSVRISMVQKALLLMDVPLDVIQGRNISGVLDAYARLRGSLSAPIYQGWLMLRDGSYSDAKLGLVAQGINGHIRLNGVGFENPSLHYAGKVKVKNGQFLSQAYHVNVRQWSGDVDFKGAVQNGKATVPWYSGFLQVADTSYQDPKTGLSVQKAQGIARFGGDTIRLEQVQGWVGNALLKVTGTIASDFKRYALRVVSRDIDLTRFKREVLAKLPGTGPVLDQLRPTSGRADVDLTVSTGAQINGRVDVTTLTMQTGQKDYPFRVPRLSILVDNRRISVPRTMVYYGPVALRVEGRYLSPSAYRFGVNANDVPISALRDNVSLINSLTNASIPEIWNTEGSLDVGGTISNQSHRLALDFHNVGLSWQGGDFPLYALNGRAVYQQAGKQRPLISTTGLNFCYGNSPIRIDTHNNDQFTLLVDGTLSALTVNHFLTSSRSNATPYREVPFRASATGDLAGLPGSGREKNNRIQAELFMDLNPSFKEAYKTPAPEPSSTPAPSTPSSPVSSGSAANGPLAAEPNGRVTSNSKTGETKKSFPLSGTPKQRITHLWGEVKSKIKEGFGKLRQASHKIPTPALGRGPKTLDEAESANAKGTLKNTAEKPSNTQANSSALASPNLITPARSEATATRLYPASAEPLRAPTDNPDMQQVQAPPPIMPNAALPTDDNAYLQANVLVSGTDISLQRGLVHLFEAGNLLTDGVVQHALSEAQREYHFHVYTQPEISLDRISHSSRENDFFRQATGSINADIHLDGYNQLENMTGWLNTDHVALPYLTLQELTGRMTFNGRGAQTDIQTFAIPGLETSASAMTENLFELPITLENVKLNGSLVNIDSLVEFNDKVVTPILVEQLVKNYARPWQQGDPRIPIQFRNGDLYFKEAILQNIIMNNAKSHISVYANSFFELTDASLDAAGGKATGYFSMSPNENNFMTLELNANRVKANALTRALLGVTNQVFGRLDGTVRYTTFGANDQEMQDNATGTVSLNISNGRLPAIAKVETLLTTANLIRGGVLGLNLNNLFRSLTFYDTNYFATLSGDLLIANGVLYTENLTSDGVNLDLLIQGSIDMGNGDGNMLVNGQMSQDVAGKFGALGKLSLGSFLHYIPAVGTLGKNQPGLLGYVPGVGYIPGFGPGFGGPPGEFNHFQVRIVGQMDDPSAIRDFHWVTAATASQAQESASPPQLPSKKPSK